VLEALSWCAWCGGASGNGWADMLLSWQLQISECLVEDCEAVEEGEAPTQVAKTSGIHRHYDESSMLKLH
jgi:hypothetical protein